MPTALIGHREQVRANVKQQEKAAALTSGGPSLGDSACEDPPSASIIVVISSFQAEWLDLPRLPLCLQPVEATGKGHWGPATQLGASCSRLSLSPLSLYLSRSLFLSFSLDSNTAVCSLEAARHQRPFYSSAVLRYSNVYSNLRQRQEPSRPPKEVHGGLFDQLFQKAVAIIHCQSASKHIGLV